MPLSEEQTKLLHRAVKVRRVCPNPNDLLPTDAMESVGLRPEDASLEWITAKFEQMEIGYNERYGLPEFRDDDKSKLQRFSTIWTNTVTLPGGSKKQTEAMLLVGYARNETKAGKDYVRVSRWKKSYAKQHAIGTTTAMTRDAPSPAN